MNEQALKRALAGGKKASFSQLARILGVSTGLLSQLVYGYEKNGKRYGGKWRELLNIETYGNVTILFLK